MTLLEQRLVDTQNKLLELYKRDIARLEELVAKQTELIHTYEELTATQSEFVASLTPGLRMFLWPRPLLKG